MRQNGTVKFFNASKGYGFITPDDGGKDIFVHVTAVESSGMGGLTDGMRISFETEPDKRGKGPKAAGLPGGILLPPPAPPRGSRLPGPRRCLIFGRPLARERPTCRPPTPAIC
jgi:CspA family cold shock protein